jgi:hypothetical protein
MHKKKKLAYSGTFPITNMVAILVVRSAKYKNVVQDFPYIIPTK